MAEVTFIGGGAGDSARVSRELIGAKAYNLVRMDRIGLPVPPAFVLDTGFCERFHDSGGRLPPDFGDSIESSIRQLEHLTGRTFGSRRRPLLLAVRSGAPVSMPGMMDTILNVGLNETSLRGLIRMTGNPRLAWDCYRCLTQAWGEVVGGMPAATFEDPVQARLDADYCQSAQELDMAAMRELAKENLRALDSLAGCALPEDPIAQLSRAVEAVFRSWHSDRAREYRRINNISDAIGTAVTVQTMVFGNAGGRSGAGVGFTRDPATGEARLYMDFLFNAQGEDVVSGRRNLLSTDDMQRVLPGVYDELARVATLLENEFRDLQDFEFTVEDGRLYLLQTRAGKRMPWAALQVAVDLVEQGIIEPAEALKRLEGHDLDGLHRLRMLPDPGAREIGQGAPGSTGVAVGALALNIERARAMAREGRQVILVRDALDTGDIAGLNVAAGLLTARGGRTSHAAVVARQLGVVSVVGCRALRIDTPRRVCTIGDVELREGDTLSLDGDRGAIFAGRVSVVEERPERALARLADWRGAAARAAG